VCGGRGVDVGDHHINLRQLHWTCHVSRVLVGGRHHPTAPSQVRAPTEQTARVTLHQSLKSIALSPSGAAIETYQAQTVIRDFPNSNYI